MKCEIKRETCGARLSTSDDGVTAVRRAEKKGREEMRGGGEESSREDEL